MNKIFGFLTFVLLISLTACKSSGEKTEEVQRQAMKIVSTDGSLTEIIYDLGYGNEIVAADVTSTFPEQAQEKATLEHASQMTAEGIISMEPTHVIGFETSIKPDLVEQLKAAGITVTLLKRDYTVEGSKQTVKSVAEWLGNTEKGNELISKIEKDVQKLEKTESKPKVLFIYARGTGMMMVAGENTPMESFIELAGGQNAVSGFEQYKPLTPEAVIEANPDLILMFDSGVESLNGPEAIFDIPGVKLTNAGKNRAYLTIDGLLMSGFGPRVGEALRILNKKLVELK
ncbi:MAG: ABC transporter substrate-binding protein [Flavobacteriia bacterium]|nr:ABC transporter substrate-binding protein [Flavobacteriia bacterium]OJX36741.1 MAG: hypothetical protein BGO87_13185 [Flavobacteriia bacterium 40-80]